MRARRGVWKGETYFGTVVEVKPATGQPLGMGGGVPCEDGGGEATADGIPLLSIPGVSPEIAVAWVEFADMVFVREGVEDLPRELRRLMRSG